MIAYKFLAAGAVAPFTGFVWPVPASAGSGPWVSAPGDDERHWIHAARAEDLPYWLDEELWRIELDGPIRAHPTQLAAPRGRLVERAEGWTAEAAKALGAASARRVQGGAAAIFEAEGLLAEAEALRAATSVEGLRNAVLAARAGGRVPAKAMRIAEYASDARHRLEGGEIAGVLYIAANAAVLQRGSREGAAEERAWQARWIVDRIGL